MALAHRNYSDAMRTSIVEPLESRQMFAAGALDPSFSFDGKATVNFGGAPAVAADVAVQADGKAVVAGTVTFTTRDGGTINRFAVARFNLDGTLDRTFGPSRSGTTTFGVGDRGDASASSLAIDLIGNIAVAGTAATSSGKQFAVARLLPNGLPDTSFDGDGKRTIRIKDQSSAEDVAIGADGKIVVAGGDRNGGDYDFAVARLRLDGSLDPTFDRDGKRIIGLGANEIARAVTIDYTGTPGINPNFGKIILAGHRFGPEYAIVRLSGQGALDGTFDGNGSFIGKIPGRSSVRINGLVIQPDEKIVLAGDALSGSTSLDTNNNTAAFDTSMILVRHNVNGSIDRSFGAGGNGVAVVDFGGLERGGDVINAANGGLILAGTTSGKYALAGLTRDGRIDTTFGAGGKVVTDFAADGTADLVRMAGGKDNRVVVVGGARFKTARYLDFGAASPGAANLNLTARSRNTALAGRIFSDLQI